MRERRERLRRVPALLALLGAGLFVGCGAPPATLELIGVAQKALRETSALEKERHAEELRRLESMKAALDAAFDADVKLAEAGRITDAQGRPVRLSAEWVISARKGYAAARDALSEQQQRLQAAQATHLDNLAAAAEALTLARNLILQQASLSGRARQFLMSLQRRFLREHPESR